MSGFIDDENDQDELNDDASAEPRVRYAPKRARSPLVLMLAMMLFAMLAIAGIVVAVTRDHKDPNTIQLPVHTMKSLDQDQPRAKAEAMLEQQTGDDYIDGMVEDHNELPASKIEELEQHETPLDLKAPVTPVPEFSPQGFVPHIREQKNISQTLVHYQKPVIKQPVIKYDAPKPAIVHGKAPMIVIVIDDMGLNHRNSQRVVELEAPITLAYLPYAERLPEQTQKAYAKGHELIVHMPMEPDNIARNNPGPNALLSTLSDQENVQRLKKNLSQFELYMGLNNHMGSKLTADSGKMRAILQEVKAKGLWFLDSKTIGHSVAGSIAEELGIPYAVRDVFLDNVASVGAVKAQLQETQKVALARGYAIAIGHPHDATIQALQEWLPQAHKQGFNIVPLSRIIAQRYPQSDVPRYARTKKQSTEMHADQGSMLQVNSAHNG